MEGNDDGIVQIIEDHQDGLMLYLNSLIQDIHPAEDFTEDTYVKLIARRPRFSGESTFMTRLYSVGRNVALNHLQKTLSCPGYQQRKLYQNTARCWFCSVLRRAYLSMSLDKMLYVEYIVINTSSLKQVYTNT